MKRGPKQNVQIATHRPHHFQGGAPHGDAGVPAIAGLQGLQAEVHGRPICCGSSANQVGAAG